MAKAALIKYLVAFFEATIPVTNHSYYEKVEVTRARYESIAETIAEVSVESPLFAGDVSGVKTGTLLGSIATFEGSLHADIDSCKKGGDIDEHGVTHAWTLWQMHQPKEKVCASRLAGARAAREMVRDSFKACSKNAVPDRLSFYTDGVCKDNWNRSRHRMMRAQNWVNSHPFKSENENESLRELLESPSLFYGNDGSVCSCSVRRRAVGICQISPACNCVN